MTAAAWLAVLPAKARSVGVVEPAAQKVAREVLLLQPPAVGELMPATAPERLMDQPQLETKPPTGASRVEEPPEVQRAARQALGLASKS